MQFEPVGQILGVAEQILRNVAIPGVEFGASVGAKQLAELERIVRLPQELCSRGEVASGFIDHPEACKHAAQVAKRDPFEPPASNRSKNLDRAL